MWWNYTWIIRMLLQEWKHTENVENWAHIQRVCSSRRKQNTTRRRKDDKPNLHSFEMGDECDYDSLVASVEVNNVNQVTAGQVICVTLKNGTWHGLSNIHTPIAEIQGIVRIFMNMRWHRYFTAVVIHGDQFSTYMSSIDNLGSSRKTLEFWNCSCIKGARIEQTF